MFARVCVRVCVALLCVGVLWGHRCIKYGGEMHFVDEKNNLSCHVEVDPQPHQSYISSWFRSKKSLGYKPDQVRGGPLRHADRRVFWG